MDKHAYLIMAHNDENVLKKQLALLDSSYNDLYIHIDKKSVDIQEDNIRKVIKMSNVHFVNRIDVQWGGDSMIKCEMMLLKEAVQKKYMYYHLISGVDLPIKSQSFIHNFFNENNGKEYVSFDSTANTEQNFLERVKYFDYFQDIIGRNRKYYVYPFIVLQKISIGIQKILNIDRTKKAGFHYFKGTNWFSITHDLAQYVVSKEDFIKKYFYHTVCADEVFLQTLIMNSDYKQNIVDNSLRFIDWNRGQPYTFRTEDVDTLLSSEQLWARKFNSNIDDQAIELVFNHISREIYKQNI